MRAVLALALLAAGCGEAPQPPSEDQLANLSSPAEPPPADPRDAIRLAPLSRSDVAAFGPGSCRFAAGGRVLVAADQQDSIARVGGRLLHFAQSSPVGPTGGFFEDRQISLSIGRVQSAEGPVATAAGWPALLTVTNRRDDVQIELSGYWRCGP